MMQRVRKGVFSVAGMGTRFLPATKAAAKEMLPIVDKPLIQYAAEEAIEAGADTLIFVTGRTKRSIADHFDKAYELENELEARGKLELLDKVRDILPKGVSAVHIRQSEPLGLGHAVLCAKPVVGNEPFGVILADDLVYNQGQGCLSQMQILFAQHNRSILAVEEVPREDTKSYGIVATGERQGRLSSIESIIEKPGPEDAPSNLAVIGRYILTPQIFDHLQTIQPGSGNEIQLTDAIARLMRDDQVFAFNFEGKRYDCGSKLGYQMANVEYGLRHKQIGPDFRSYLLSIATELAIQAERK
jgi:UTP--glucose-1-phosphate uridylyltransferase